MRETGAYAKRYHAIAEASLVAPSYHEIMALFDSDAKVIETRAKLDECEAMLHEAPNGPKRYALEEEIEGYRIWCDLLLPEDFLSRIMTYALQLDDSDIDQVTTEVLLDCAILAERGHNDPAAHLDGRFTPFMRDDINRRAWMIYHEWREANPPPEQRQRRLKVPSGR
jgi:hypothetical protein